MIEIDYYRQKKVHKCVNKSLIFIFALKWCTVRIFYNFVGILIHDWTEQIQFDQEI